MFWPGVPVRTLLAVLHFVLWRVRPCVFAETIHHSMESTIREVEQVVNVVENHDISVEVNDFLIFFEQPDAELGVVDHVVSHSKVALITTIWANGLDFSDDTSMKPEQLTVAFRDIMEDGNDEGISRFNFTKAFSKANDTFNIITRASKEGNEGTGGQSHGKKSKKALRSGYGDGEVQAMAMQKKASELSRRRQ